MSNFHVCRPIFCLLPFVHLRFARTHMLSDRFLSAALSVSSFFFCRLQFIKNVAGPEFESFAKCMEKSDPAKQVMSDVFRLWCSLVCAGIPTEFQTVARNKQHMRLSLTPLLLRIDINGPRTQ
jgi:hypothetical protein